MEYLGVIISVVGSVIAIAVAWGWNSARLEETARWRAEMEKKMDALLAVVVTKEHCTLKHSYLEQTISEIKSDVKEIKELLQDILKEFPRK